MSAHGSPWRQFRRGFADGWREAKVSKRLKIVAGVVGGMVGIGYIVALG